MWVPLLPVPPPEEVVPVLMPLTPPKRVLLLVPEVVSELMPVVRVDVDAEVEVDAGVDAEAEADVVGREGEA